MCPTEKESKIVEDLVVRAVAHSAQEHGVDATRNVSRERVRLKNFTEDEWTGGLTWVKPSCLGYP